MIFFEEIGPDVSRYSHFSFFGVVVSVASFN